MSRARDLANLGDINASDLTTGTLGNTVQDNITRLGTVTTGTMNNTIGSSATFPTGSVIKKTVGFAGTGTDIRTNLTGAGSDSYTATGLYTPNFSCDSRTNKLIVEVHTFTLQNDPQYTGMLTLYKGGTDVFASSGENDLMRYYVQSSTSQTVITNHLVYVDNSPTTTATDYRVYGKVNNTSNYFRISYDAGTYMIFTELA